jgi:hypothetical protein
MVWPQFPQKRASSGMLLPQLVQNAMKMCDPPKSKRNPAAKGSLPERPV